MRFTLAGILLVACGGGGSNPDARPMNDARVNDAAPRVYCYAETTTACGYAPEDLTPAELSLPDQAALASRFKPSVVYTGDDIWAVSLNYVLEEAQPRPVDPPRLRRAEYTTKLNFSYQVNEASYVDAYSDPQPDLTMTDFRDLPLDDGGSINYAYFLDGQGTNTGNDLAEETWTAAWRGIQGYADPATVDPTAAPYPPHYYVHLFWLSKADDLLVLQFWSYYPYDKFSNNHEGDWEHVNVVLDVADWANPFPAFFQYSWHGQQIGTLASESYRVSGPDDGDHMVAFVGGEVCTDFNEIWCGDTSGASYPYPGVWEFGQTETVAGYTGKPGRAIHASDFTLDVLARPQDMDFAARPDLSWYQLPFLFGEPITAANDAVVVATNNHRAPVGPGPDHEEFEIGIEDTDPDILADSTSMPFVVPSGWTLISEPPESAFP